MVHIWRSEDPQELVLPSRGNQVSRLVTKYPSCLSETSMVNGNKNWKNSKHRQDTASFRSCCLNSSHGKNWDTDPQGFAQRQTLLGHPQWTTSCSRHETFPNAGSEICLDDSHMHLLQLLAHCHLLEVSKTASCRLSLTNNNLGKIGFSCRHCLIYVKYAYLWWSWICLMHAMPSQLKQYSCLMRQQHVRMCAIAVFS